MQRDQPPRLGGGRRDARDDEAGTLETSRRWTSATAAESSTITVRQAAMTEW